MYCVEKCRGGTGFEKTNEKHNYNLDLMKIFACIAVVGLHTLQKIFH